MLKKLKSNCTNISLILISSSLFKIKPNHCFHLEGPAHDIVSSGVQSHWKENWSKIRGRQIWCQLSWLVQKVRFDFPSIKFPLLQTSARHKHENQPTGQNWQLSVLMSCFGRYCILMDLNVRSRRGLVPNPIFNQSIKVFYRCWFFISIFYFKFKTYAWSVCFAKGYQSYIPAEYFDWIDQMNHEFQ